MIGPSVGLGKLQKDHIKINIITWYFPITRITVSTHARLKKYSYSLLKQMDEYFYASGTSKAAVYPGWLIECCTYM